MRSTRLALTVTTLALITALTACSGDSDSGDTDAQTTPPPPGQTSGDTAKAFEKRCSVTVTVTGDVEASWEGRGTASNASQVTTYRADHGQDQVLVYAGNGDIPTNANLTVAGATYTTEDAAGLDVAKNGSAATVDQDVSGVGGTAAHLQATFTCGKAAKG